MSRDKHSIDDLKVNFNKGCMKFRVELIKFMEEYSKKNNDLQTIQVLSVLHGFIGTICQRSKITKEEFDIMHKHTRDTYYNPLSKEDIEFGEEMSKRLKE